MSSTILTSPILSLVLKNHFRYNPSMMMPPLCPLCLSDETTEYFNHRYFKCSHCDLIYLAPNLQISKEEEKKRYATHNNDPKDNGYRQFLSRLMDPVLNQISPNSKGLDFGSGPGPTLALMFEEKGFDMAIFDPYFANHPQVLQTSYDFVTSSEVVEHFSSPKASWDQLTHLVKPGGTLGIMTEIMNDSINFEKWYYKNDDTHIAFYSLDTFAWIEHTYHLTRTYADSRVIVFNKQ